MRIWQYEQEPDSLNPQTDADPVFSTNNLAAMDGKAVSVTPPDASSNNTWFLAPRSALKLCKVLGVIGGPAAKRKAEAAPGQVSLFD